MKAPQETVPPSLPPAFEGSRDFSVDSRVLVMTLGATAIGAVGTAVAVILVRLIGLFTNAFYYHRLATSLVSPAGNTLGVAAVLIPVAGGVIVGLMARYGSEKIRGHGIPEAIEAILLGESRIEPKVAALKPLSSALAIGSGGPFGAEGPIIMTGGALGSLVAQAFELSAAERKTLLAAGAAAGMAAIFATPVAAVVLAVELLLFEWKPRSFIPVAAAAATAALLRVPVLGPGPLFPIGPHGALGAQALLASLALGIATGAAATAVSALVYRCEDWFGRLPIHWMWWPALGGVVVGLGGLVCPRALGVGYDVIHDLLQGGVASPVLARLLVVKAIIWAVALGSGTSGGVLAPLLIMGGALGSLAAHWVGAPDAAVWAAIAMGAMMAGTMHAPFTAIIFVTELTGDVTTLPGLLIACIAATAFAVLGMRHSILTEKLARRGQHVTREYIVNPLHLLRVGDVMDRDVPTVPATLAVDDLFRRLADEDPVLGRRHAWPLVDETGKLVGLLTRGDLVRALESAEDGASGATVLAASPGRLIVAYPDELLEAATERMLRHDIGRLLVVRRDAPAELVGYLGRAGVMAAWLRLAREEQERTPGWLAGVLERARRALGRKTSARRV